jgi:DNA-binding IclR family transcriptional regulator
VRLRVPASHPDALLAVVDPHLTKLSAATGETTHLMVLHETSVRFIHSVEGPAALRVAYRPGASMPAIRELITILSSTAAAIDAQP